MSKTLAPGMMWPQPMAPDAPTARALCDALATAGLHGFSPLALMCGCALGQLPTVLLGLERAERAQAQPLLIEASASGYGVLLGVEAAALDAPGGWRAKELGMVFGLGGVIASSGVTGAPLVGMGLAQLRDELKRSRERLSEACGYEVITLWPRHDKLWRGVDGLILEEAQRAGYTRCVRAGLIPDVASSWSAQDAPKVSVVELRPLDDEALDVEALARWACGQPLDQVRGALGAAKTLMRGVLRGR